MEPTDIYHCCVYSDKTPHDGQRSCPKHVEFYSKNKFEKLGHLVGFINKKEPILFLYFPYLPPVCPFPFVTYQLV